MELNSNKFEDLARKTIVDQYVFKLQIVKPESLFDFFYLTKRNLWDYCDYLFYEDFAETMFAYKYNEFYKDKFITLKEHLEKKILFFEADRHSKYKKGREIEQTQLKLEKIWSGINALREEYNQGEPIYWNEEYFNYWNQRTYRERKKIIRKYYSRGEYKDFRYFLNKVNEYLKVIADYSFDLCDREYCMCFFQDFGQSFDWLFLLLTETNFKKRELFVKLFQAHIVVQNDLIAVTGAINVLMERKALDECFGGEFAHQKEYLELFAGVLESGREVTKLFMDLQKKMDISSSKKISEDSYEAEMAQELESLHQMGVNYAKIHDIDLKPFEEEDIGEE